MGLFEYKTLQFDVASAPSIFQWVMENLLQGIPGVSIYRQYSHHRHHRQDHLENLTQILHRLEEAGVRLKREKCAFLLPTVATSSVPMVYTHLMRR